MTRGYKTSDWPKSRRRDFAKDPRRKKRIKKTTSALTPIEEWIENNKKKEQGRPFDDLLPW
jgi:hypothetical protein